jgi:hypothetical protein
MSSQLLYDSSPSLGTLSVGGTLFFWGRARELDWLQTVGMFMVFFGAQTGMNIYMKFALSAVVVNPDEGWKGLPASFFVTGAQQFFGFVIFWVILGLGRALKPILGGSLSCWTEYEPRKLDPKDILIVCLFSLAFIMNIALNNFSLSLITITLNLIIRSCLPLSTYIAQNAAAKMTRKEGTSLNLVEMSLMLAGVLFAALAVTAKMEGSSKATPASKNLLFGVIVCIVSLLAGSLNLVLAGVLGTNVKLNSLDTTVYNAIPACIILTPIVLYYEHPINWRGHKADTDMNILSEAWNKEPLVVYLALASGALALAYNTLQFGIVQDMSATHVAFAGNFNKACMVPLSFITGMESLPPGLLKIDLPAGPVMIIASMGSILAFALYNMVSKGKGGGHGAATPALKKDEPKDLEDNDDDDSDDDDDSEDD